MKKLRHFLLLLAGLWPLQAAASPSFAVYYSDKAEAAAFSPFDLVVFDSDRHPPVAPLQEEGKTVLGYISIGEVEKNRAYYGKMKNAGLFIRQNENWPDSQMIDIRNPLWTRMVVEELVPAILAQGFNGVFLDTLDNPVELERANPQRYRGMSKAAAGLVKAIRLNYPNITIMMNRGYGLLPEVASVIDMELGESVYTDYNFSKKTYGRVAGPLYAEQVNLLKAAQKTAPRLKIYTLDYWRENDPQTISQIYRTQRANGFIPYVATVSLDKVVHEPATP